MARRFAPRRRPVCGNRRNAGFPPAVVQTDRAAHGRQRLWLDLRETRFRFLRPYRQLVEIGIAEPCGGVVRVSVQKGDALFRREHRRLSLKIRLAVRRRDTAHGAKLERTRKHIRITRRQQGKRSQQQNKKTGQTILFHWFYDDATVGENRQPFSRLDNPQPGCYCFWKVASGAAFSAFSCNEAGQQKMSRVKGTSNERR